MILYLDTSALVKLYIQEPGTSVVRAALDEAEVIATSEIAYVECRAALARRRREGHIGASDHGRFLKAFRADWCEYLLLGVGSTLIESAGEVADREGLRAYDAVHIASAQFLQRELNTPVTFACWDVALAKAAARVSLELLAKAPK